MKYRVGDIVHVEGEGEMEIPGFEPGSFRSIKVKAVRTRVVKLNVNESLVRPLDTSTEGEP